jgi:ATP-dependent DNA ligase
MNPAGEAAVGKIQLNCAQEFVIAGYTIGNPFDALIVGCYEGGNLTYVGKVRNGFVRHTRRELMAKMKPLKIDA